MYLERFLLKTDAAIYPANSTKQTPFVGEVAAATEPGFPQVYSLAVFAPSLPRELDQADAVRRRGGGGDRTRISPSV